MSRSLRRCLLRALAHVLGFTIIVLTVMLGAGRFLVSQDALTPADAIVVLGGEDNGFPRTRHALDLFRASYAPTVVFSGGTLKDAGLACSSAQLSLEAARQLGLPVRSAVIAPEAQSTYDEALNLRAMAQEHEWQTLILVTDIFHTRRAARTFRAVMPGVSVRVSAAPDPRYDPVNWWRTEDGLVSVFTELIKLIFYWTKYGIRPF